MSKPIVAVVTDETGTYLRMSGEVTVVWVYPNAKDDRVFEVARRETTASLKRFLGDRKSWGHDQDDIQKQAEKKMGSLGLIEPGRAHLRKLYALAPPVLRANKRTRLVRSLLPVAAAGHKGE